MDLSWICLQICYTESDMKGQMVWMKSVVISLFYVCQHVFYIFAVQFGCFCWKCFCDALEPFKYCHECQSFFLYSIHYCRKVQCRKHTTAIDGEDHIWIWTFNNQKEKEKERETNIGFKHMMLLAFINQKLRSLLNFWS